MGTTTSVRQIWLSYSGTGVHANSNLCAQWARLAGVMAVDIAKIAFVRSALETQCFDSDKRFQLLTFTLHTVDTLVVTCPAGGLTAHV